LGRSQQSNQLGGILTDEEILAELASEPTTEEPKSKIPPDVVTKHEAIQGLQKLQMYLMQSSEDRSDALKFLASVEKDIFQILPYIKHGNSNLRVSN